MSKKTKATGFYNSKAWQETRNSYKRSKGGLCERCIEKGIIKPADIVHHKVPLTEDNIQDLSLSLGWNNLQALCNQCHREVHKQLDGNPIGRRYYIDKAGRVVIIAGMVDK